MKNICIDARYIFPQMDGIGRYLYHLIEAISRITINDPDYHFLILELEEFADNSVLRNLDDRQNLSFIKLKIRPQSLANHIIHTKLKSWKIDVFHYPQFDFPAFLPFRSVITIHDLNPQMFPDFFNGISGVFKRLYAIVTHYWGIERAAGIITVSQHTSNEQSLFYGERFLHKTTPIWLAVESKSIVQTSESQDSLILEKVQRLVASETYFLYVGNNRPHKNLKRLIEAYSRIKNEDTEAPGLLLVGNFGNYSKYDVAAHIKELNMERYVAIFSASEEELRKLYKNAVSLVFVSLSEGFGFPVLEAMVAGLPVIASNTGAVAEVAGDASLAVDPLSVDSIAEAMRKIKDSPQLRRDLVDKGLRRVRNFSWENCALHTIEVYKKAMIQH